VATGEVWDRIANIAFDNYEWIRGTARININKEDHPICGLTLALAKSQRAFTCNLGKHFDGLA